MFNADDLVKAMKKSAVEAIQASKPANMVLGTVISAAPLKIKIDQKLVLGTAQLTLTRNVTDYSLVVTPEWTTGSAGDPTHAHAIAGQKTIKIHNALKVGEQVALMHNAGGQKYIVIDRV